MKNSRRLCFIIEDLTFISEVQEKDSQHTQIHVWFFIPIESSHRGKKYKISKLLPLANEVWGKVIFSVACVKNSVYRGGGGGGIPACLAGLGGGLQTHTREGGVRAVRILLECILVYFLFLVINSLVTLNLKLDITWVLHFQRLLGFPVVIFIVVTSLEVSFTFNPVSIQWGFDTWIVHLPCLLNILATNHCVAFGWESKVLSFLGTENSTAKVSSLLFLHNVPANMHADAFKKVVFVLNVHYWIGGNMWNQFSAESVSPNCVSGRTSQSYPANRLYFIGRFQE